MDGRYRIRFVTTHPQRPLVGYEYEVRQSRYARAISPHLTVVLDQGPRRQMGLDQKAPRPTMVVEQWEAPGKCVWNLSFS